MWSCPSCGDNFTCEKQLQNDNNNYDDKINENENKKEHEIKDINKDERKMTI